MFYSMRTKLLQNLPLISVVPSRPSLVPTFFTSSIFPPFGGVGTGNWKTRMTILNICADNSCMLYVACAYNSIIVATPD